MSEHPTLFGPADSTIPTAAWVCLHCGTVNPRDVWPCMVCKRRAWAAAGPLYGSALGAMYGDPKKTGDPC